eukprot:351140-Chlamydomonas_euryale.AAC.25
MACPAGLLPRRPTLLPRTSRRHAAQAAATRAQSGRQTSSPAHNHTPTMQCQTQIPRGPSARKSGQLPAPCSSSRPAAATPRHRRHQHPSSSRTAAAKRRAAFAAPSEPPLHVLGMACQRAARPPPAALQYLPSAAQGVLRASHQRACAGCQCVQAAAAAAAA